MLISINERGIFHVNVYIEMKTEFKILVYFITFLTPGKSVRTHSQEHPYGAHIFTPSLFFINPDTCVENSVRTFLCPFCAYAAFIHEPHGVRFQRNHCQGASERDWPKICKHCRKADSL